MSTESKAPMLFDQRTGIALRNTDDLKTLATILLREGVVPNSLKTVGQVIVALQTGAEVGLKPMQSVRYIAVVNGAATIWGEGAKGLVLNTGLVEAWEDWWEVGGTRIEGDPADLGETTVAVTRLKRRGGGEVTRRFSVADAKRAGLWSKKGPWQAYPQRMLRVRAMTLAMRDLFADALGGLAIREEVLDTPPQEREAEFTTLGDLGLGGAESPAVASEPEDAPEAYTDENGDDVPPEALERHQGPEFDF